MGAPYELWVGSDATVGTSVGQVRVVDMEGSELMFDMFHSYQEGGELNGRRFFFSVSCFIIIFIVGLWSLICHPVSFVSEDV